MRITPPQLPHRDPPPPHDPEESFTPLNPPKPHRTPPVHPYAPQHLLSPSQPPQGPPPITRTLSKPSGTTQTHPFITQPLPASPRNTPPPLHQTPPPNTGELSLDAGQLGRTGAAARRGGAEHLQEGCGGRHLLGGGWGVGMVSDAGRPRPPSSHAPKHVGCVVVGKGAWLAIGSAPLGLKGAAPLYRAGQRCAVSGTEAEQLVIAGLQADDLINDVIDLLAGRTGRSDSSRFPRCSKDNPPKLPQFGSRPPKLSSASRQCIAAAHGSDKHSFHPTNLRWQFLTTSPPSHRGLRCHLQAKSHRNAPKLHRSPPRMQ